MYAVDTNVLVRALLDDAENAGQSESAQLALSDAQVVWLPQVVLAELSWVLKTSYRLGRAQILAVMKSLLDNPRYRPQLPEDFAMAVALFEKGTAEFSDCLILAAARHAKAELLTFDRKFARLEGAKLIL